MRRTLVLLFLLTPVFLAACVSNPCNDTAYLHARTVPAAPVLQTQFFKLPMSRAYAVPDLPPGSPPLTRANSCLIVPPLVTPRPEAVQAGGAPATKSGS
jgi:hypothetical protein